MASRGGHPSVFSDSFSNNGTRRRGNNKENTSMQSLNARKAELARPGRVLNKYINRGGNSRSSLPGGPQEYRIVKDNRIKQKESSEIVPEVFNTRNFGNERAFSNVDGRSSTGKVAVLHSLVTANGNGRGAAQVDHCIRCAAQVLDKEASSVRKLEQSEGMQTTLVGSHGILRKGMQSREGTVASGKNNFSGELCCSSSDPIHVPSPGSKSVGNFGAIKREVGVVGARQWPSDKPGTNTSPSNSVVELVSALNFNHSNEQRSGLPVSSLKNSRNNFPIPLSSRSFPSSQYHHKPQSHVSHTKGSTHLEWKPKSISLSSTNQEVSVSTSGAPSPVGNQAEVAILFKKLLQVNVSGNEQVIIPEHIQVPDSERTHLIFGTFEPEVSGTSRTTSDTVVTKDYMNDNSPSSLTASNAIISTDIPPNDNIDTVVSQRSLPHSISITSVSEHQKSLSEAVEVPSLCVVGELVTKAISSKVTHSQPQFQHQDNLVVPTFKIYKPDSRYGAVPFLAQAIDDETAESITYPSEVMGLHLANANQLPAVTQQSVPQMSQQQFQVPQYPNFLPYRHVYSPHFVPPMVPTYSSNPAFPQLPHASSYLVMPNGTPQLAVNGMKYGLHHQYKQVFPGTPAGYGGYANHIDYTFNTGVIGGTEHVEDVNMSKYKDNNLYTPNPQAETSDMWVQGHREIPNMPLAPFYNVMGQPMPPHAAYLPSQNGHAAFTPAPPHPAHLQYPCFPHTLQPTSMAMVQNTRTMIHQAAMPQLVGNLGLDMATLASGSQVGAFQQNQFGQIGWAPTTY